MALLALALEVVCCVINSGSLRVMRLYYWIHWKAVTKLVMPVSYPILRGFDPLSVDSFVPNAGVRSPRLVSIAFVSEAGVRSPCLVYIAFVSKAGVPLA